MKEPIDVNKDVTLNERYNLLINARNFHYTNFSKWASYFYLAIGALFVAYYSISSSPAISDLDKKTLGFVVLFLGYTGSLIWYWSTKGYYYWNINFITLVNNFESEHLKWTKEERVYFVFANKSTQNNYASPIHGANISTSKLAILFSYLVTTAWGFLLFYKILILCLNSDCFALIILLSALLSFCSVLILSITFAKYLLLSKIDHFPDLEITQELK